MMVDRPINYIYESSSHLITAIVSFVGNRERCHAHFTIEAWATYDERDCDTRSTHYR